MTTAQIAVLTSTRADYGILSWILRTVQDAADLELALYVTGTHLSPAHGETVHEIERDGLPIRRRTEILLASDGPVGASKAMALALVGFGEALGEDRPDLMLMVGDRFEIVPVALACVLHGVPVAHLHGGEATEGAVDEYFRHAVTKLATLHFPATDTYRRRILQMGEPPDRVHAFGAPGLDHLYRTPLLDRDQLARELNMELDRPTAVVTFHPLTTEPGRAANDVEALLAGLLDAAPLQAVITKANADPEGLRINRRLEAFSAAHPDRVRLFDNLGTRRYLSCLKHLDLLIGNSSSGLVEAPSFAIPVVDVGSRQRGRVRAANVLHAEPDANEVGEAIRAALAPAFRAGLEGMTNPYDHYGDGRVSERIVDELRRYLSEPGPPGKCFVDLPSASEL